MIYVKKLELIQIARLARYLDSSTPPNVLSHPFYLHFYCIGSLEDIPQYGNEFDNNCHMSFT